MKRRKREPQLLSKSEQLALLKQPNPRAPTGLRNLCLISLMLKTGIKAAEIINLRENDLDWDRGLIFLEKSGGANERHLKVDEVELSLLKSWRRIKPTGSPLLFTTLQGKSLKDRYLREMIKRYAQKAGIKKDVYPHLLRTTFALNFLDQTRNIDLLQKALGHRDQSTTQNYVSLYFVEYAGLKGRPDPEREIFADLIREREESRIKEFAEDVIPYITIESGDDTAERLAIPAMKCCQCSFILHYQGDCPQCGAAFSTILRHWGKTI